MQKALEHQPRPRDSFKVFLTGIAVDFDRRKLYSFFKRHYPSVIRVDLIKQKEDPELNKGFGFIELLDREEQQAILKQEEFYFSGRIFSAKEHKTGEALEKYKNAVDRRRLFVCNVNLEVTDKDLKSFFSEYAFIENAYLVNRKKTKVPNQGASGKSKPNPEDRTGYGYVVVRTERDARILLETQKFWIKGKKAIVKPFNAKKHRKHEQPSNKNQTKIDLAEKKSQKKLTKKRDFVRKTESPESGLSQIFQATNELYHSREEFTQPSATMQALRRGSINLNRQINSLNSSQPLELYPKGDHSQSHWRYQRENKKITKNEKNFHFEICHQLERFGREKSVQMVPNPALNDRICYDQEQYTHNHYTERERRTPPFGVQGPGERHDQTQSEGRRHFQAVIQLRGNVSYYDSRFSSEMKEKLHYYAETDGYLRGEPAECHNQPFSRKFEQFSDFSQFCLQKFSARENQGQNSKMSCQNSNKGNSNNPKQIQRASIRSTRQNPSQTFQILNRASPQQPIPRWHQIPQNINEALEEEVEEEVLSIHNISSVSSTSGPRYIPRSLPADSRDALKNHLMSYRVQENHHRHNILMKILRERNDLKVQAQKFKK